MQAGPGLRSTPHGHTTHQALEACPPTVITSESQGHDSALSPGALLAKMCLFPCLCLPTNSISSSFHHVSLSAGPTSHLVQRLWKEQVGFPALAELEDRAGGSCIRC